MSPVWIPQLRRKTTMTNAETFSDELKHLAPKDESKSKRGWTL